jgi:hypothetical protein
MLKECQDNEGKEVQFANALNPTFCSFNYNKVIIYKYESNVLDNIFQSRKCQIQIYSLKLHHKFFVFC